MSRRSLFAVAALLVLTVSAAATPFTDAFTGLLTEATTRRNALLAGTQDTTTKAQEKALGKTIAKLAKPGSALAADLKQAVSVFAKLEKAFPADFATTTPPSFGSFVAAALGVFDTYVEAQYSLLASALTSVTDPKLHASADLLRRQARGDLDLVATTKPASAAARQLVKALTRIAKGRSFAAMQKVTDVMTASVDDGPFAATTFSVDAITKDGYLDAIGTVSSQQSSNFRQIELITSAITGPGTYSTQGTYEAGKPYAYHISFSGSVTFTTFDLAGKHVVGDFAFTTQEPLPANQIHVTSGHFDIRHIRVH